MNLTTNIPFLWYIGRVTGISAFIMYTLAVCTGLAMTSKLFLRFRFIPAPDALQSHSFNASVAAFTLALIHIISLLLNPLSDLSLTKAFLPFLYKTEAYSVLNGNLQVPGGLGTIAFYIALLLIITSKLKNKVIPSKYWRIVHYLSFVFYLLILVHGLSLGSDSGLLWVKLIYAGSFLLVFLLVLLRIFGKYIILPKKQSLQNPPIGTTND